jgi:hypothetical protein
VDRTLGRLLALVDPDWELRAAESAGGGLSATYRLTVDTPAGERACFLKPSWDSPEPGISVGGRVTALLQGRLPVPPVLGVVDEHPELPAPAHLTAPLPGEGYAYEAVGWADAAFLRQLTRDWGGRSGGSTRSMRSTGSATWPRPAARSRAGDRPGRRPT